MACKRHSLLKILNIEYSFSFGIERFHVPLIKVVDKEFILKSLRGREKIRN